MDQPLTQTTKPLTREELARKQAQQLSQSQWGDYSYEHQVETNTASGDSTLVSQQDAQAQTDLQAKVDKLADSAWTNWANNLAQPDTQSDLQPNFQPQTDYQLSQDTSNSLSFDSSMVKPEEVAQLEKIVEFEQKETEHDEAIVLEALEQSGEFSRGNINFEQKTPVESPVPQPESTFGQEPQLPAEHAVQEPVNLQKPTEYHANVDFGFFFKTTGGWAKEAAGEGSKFVLKTVFNKKSWGEVKSAVWDNLFWKQVFKPLIPLPEKKEPSKEEKEKKAKKAGNMRLFFSALKDGLRGLISLDQKRAFKQRLEALNKSLKRGNLSYEGSMANGQIREDLLVASEKANSQKSEEQIRAEKRQKLMAATGSVKKGPGITTSMDKAHNFNNAAKLAG
jgi:hypothetical protein